MTTEALGAGIDAADELGVRTSWLGFCGLPRQGSDQRVPVVSLVRVLPDKRLLATGEHPDDEGGLLQRLGSGLLTIKEGGAVVSGNTGALAAAGNYVPFVVWFNFLAGFFYVAAGIGLFMQKRWAMWLALAIAVSTAVTSAALGAVIVSGGAFEQRTAFAMGLRTIVWMVIAAVAWRRLAHRTT